MDKKLRSRIFAPPGAETKRPAIIFFFSGGWAAGSPAQFEQQCQYNRAGHDGHRRGFARSRPAIT